MSDCLDEIVVIPRAFLDAVADGDFVDVGGLTQSSFVNPNLCPTCIITTSSAPRVGVGVGISWHTQFGLLNVDLTPFVVKQPKDQTQVFRFGFGTRFLCCHPAFFVRPP